MMPGASEVARFGANTVRAIRNAAGFAIDIVDAGCAEPSEKAASRLV